MFASTVYWARNCSHNPSKLTTYTKINENEKPTIDISTQFFPVIQFSLSYNFIVHVFNFPRFYSIFCVDFSQLFDPFHTYLKHGTVMGSNICEWKQKYL